MIPSKDLEDLISKGFKVNIKDKSIVRPRGFTPSDDDLKLMGRIYFGLGYRFVPDETIPLVSDPELDAIHRRLFGDNYERQ